MRRIQRDHGAAAVEFALVSVLLVTLLLGVVEFAFFFFAQGTFSGAAREGARYYAIHYEDDPNAMANAKDRVVTAAGGAQGVSSADVKVSACPSIATTPPTSTTVEVARPYPGITGFFPVIFSSFQVKGTGVMRCGG